MVTNLNNVSIIESALGGVLVFPFFSHQYQWAICRDIDLWLKIVENCYPPNVASTYQATPVNKE